MSNDTLPAAATGLPLSAIISDPFVRAAFERAERDHGPAFAVPTEPQPRFQGGAAEQIEQEIEYV